MIDRYFQDEVIKYQGYYLQLFRSCRRTVFVLANACGWVHVD